MKAIDADITLRGSKGAARIARATSEFFSYRKRTILLIHGYNTTESEAVKDCLRFKSDIAYYDSRVMEQSFICTWAGNWGMLLARPAAYPFMLKRAVDSAYVLAKSIIDWYKRPDASSEFVMIAHSLGCRVTLETLDQLSLIGKPKNMKSLIIILMGAAVPVDYLKSLGEKSGRLVQGLKIVDKVIVCYSPHDDVLRNYFPLGQVFGMENFSEAVGLRAGPSVNIWTSVEHMEGFNHDDYWSELQMAEKICRILGVRISPEKMATPLHIRRRLPENVLHLSRHFIE